MNNNTVKLIITAVVLLVVIGIALSVLKWALRIIVPIAVLAAIAYFIYTLVVRKR